MGRELKRVPLDFKWSLNTPWKGYVDEMKGHSLCPDCDGTGNSPAMRLLQAAYRGDIPFKPETTGSQPFHFSDAVMQDLVRDNVERNRRYYGAGQDAVDREADRMSQVFNGQWGHHLNEDDVQALLAVNGLKELTHKRTINGHWRRKSPAYVPTAREVNLWLAGNFRSSDLMWTVCVAECERQGYAVACQHCNGTGGLWASPEDKRRSERWKRSEPPVGVGYQLWETVSEGSPVSPVFAEPRELAQWITRYGWTVDRELSEQQWMNFILSDGWAPTLVAGNGDVRTGVDYLNPQGRRPAVPVSTWVMTTRFGGELRVSRR